MTTQNIFSLKMDGFFHGDFHLPWDGKIHKTSPTKNTSKKIVGRLWLWKILTTGTPGEKHQLRGVFLAFVMFILLKNTSTYLEDHPRTWIRG